MENKANEANEELLDGLIGMLNHMPKPMVKMVDVKRYREVMSSAAALKELLAEELTSGKIDIHIDETFHLGAISTEIPDFSTSNIPLLLKVLAEADAVEIYPLTNGNVRLDITFQGVLKGIC